MYPEPDTRQFQLRTFGYGNGGSLSSGHFNGVCQIVSKLFDAVQPDRAYFGEKDFQHLAIIREMVRQMKYPLEIVGCPIVREEDGLALSSRNARLSDEERKNALKISQTLFERSYLCGFAYGCWRHRSLWKMPLQPLPACVWNTLNMVDGNTLQKIAELGRYFVCRGLHYGVLRRSPPD